MAGQCRSLHTQDVALTATKAGGLLPCPPPELPACLLPHPHSNFKPHPHPHTCQPACRFLHTPPLPPPPLASMSPPHTCPHPRLPACQVLPTPTPSVYFPLPGALHPSTRPGHLHIRPCLHHHTWLHTLVPARAQAQAVRAQGGGRPSHDAGGGRVKRLMHDLRTCTGSRAGWVTWQGGAGRGVGHVGLPVCWRVGVWRSCGVRVGSAHKGSAVHMSVWEASVCV